MSNILIDDLQEKGAINHINIALPTRGVFYPQGEILKDDADPDDILVKPISMINESIFTDPLMLVSGRAISKMLRLICPEIADPGRLCELDVQSILIACRIATSGPKMRVNHSCTQCQAENQLEIDLNDHILRFGPYQPEEFVKFELELPRIGQKVKLRPVSYEDSVDMTLEVIKTAQGTEKFQNVDNNEAFSEEFITLYAETFEKSIRTNISAIVSSIMAVITTSGKTVTDRTTIEEWVSAIPSEDLRAITKRIGEINNDIRERSKIDYDCNGCKQTQTIFLELDPQKLFTQAEDPSPEKSSSAKSTSTKKTTKTRSRISQK